MCGEAYDRILFSYEPFIVVVVRFKQEMPKQHTSSFVLEYFERKSIVNFPKLGQSEITGKCGSESFFPLIFFFPYFHANKRTIFFVKHLSSTFKYVLFISCRLVIL